MAGRVLPIALATVVGISIGVATFDRELKEQRRKRLQEEYDQEIAAAAAAAGQSPTPMASHAIPPPSPHRGTVSQGIKEGRTQESTTEATKAQKPETTPSWSSMLGLWAWDKNAAKGTQPKELASVQSKVDEPAGKP